MIWIICIQTATVCMPVQDLIHILIQKTCISVKQTTIYHIFFVRLLTRINTVVVSLTKYKKKKEYLF